ncbi:uncharacterized protein METZ01_LOCUS507853, partial [marine metagenome]
MHLTRIIGNGVIDYFNIRIDLINVRTLASPPCFCQAADMSSRIERTVTVSWRHQVLFTRNIFDAENATLRDVLVDDDEREPRKTLIIVDEALADARPVLVRQIKAYFNAHADSLKLV